MPTDKKFGALSAAAALTGAEAIPALQGAGNVRFTLTQAAAFILAGAALTGAPTGPTPANGDASTKLATTAFVANAIAALVNGAPGALDQLNELATAMGNDPNFSTTMLNALAGKQAAHANLAALAGLVGSAGKMPYFTGAGALALADYIKLTAGAGKPLAAMGQNAGYKLGSRYLNTTTAVRWSLIDDTANAAIWSPDGVMDHVGYQSGAWYSNRRSSTASIGISSSALYASPLTIHRKITISQLATYIPSSPGAAGSTALLGIYTNDNGSADQLVCSAVVSTSAVGTCAGALAANVEVPPGKYWLVLWSGNSASFACTGNGTEYTAASEVGYASPADMAGSSTQNPGVSVSSTGLTFASGLPQTFPAGGTRFGRAPLIGFLIA